MANNPPVVQRKSGAVLGDHAVESSTASSAGAGRAPINILRGGGSAGHYDSRNAEASLLWASPSCPTFFTVQLI